MAEQQAHLKPNSRDQVSHTCYLLFPARRCHAPGLRNPTRELQAKTTRPRRRKHMPTPSRSEVGLDRGDRRATGLFWWTSLRAESKDGAGEMTRG